MHEKYLLLSKYQIGDRDVSILVSLMFHVWLSIFIRWPIRDHRSHRPKPLTCADPEAADLHIMLIGRTSWPRRLLFVRRAIGSPTATQSGN